MKYLLLLCFVSMSCVSATSTSYRSLGGKGLYKNTGDGGFVVMHNHEKSFRDGALAVATLAASYYGAAVSKAQEVTNQVAARETTKRSIAAGREFTNQTAIGADVIKNANGHNAGMFIPSKVPTSIPR